MALNHQHITAVILAGGKGSRLQHNDKGLMLFKQRPLIEHILEAITPQLSRIMINANRNQSQYESYGYPVFGDNDNVANFQGPLAGFLTAMSQVTTSHILTIPCDAPFVATDYANRMIQTLIDHPVDIAIAHDGKRRQSIHALLPVSLGENLELFLQTGKRKVGDWYQQQTCALTDFSDKPETLLNINTLSQLQALEATHHE